MRPSFSILAILLFVFTACGGAGSSVSGSSIGGENGGFGSGLAPTFAVLPEADRDGNGDLRTLNLLNLGNFEVTISTCTSAQSGKLADSGIRQKWKNDIRFAFERAESQTNATGILEVVNVAGVLQSAAQSIWHEAQVPNTGDSGPPFLQIITQDHFTFRYVDPANGLQVETPEFFSGTATCVLNLSVGLGFMPATAEAVATGETATRLDDVSIATNGQVRCAPDPDCLNSVVEG